MGSRMPRLGKNQKCLIGRAARQAIEQESLERDAKKWARRKSTLAKYAEMDRNAGSSA
jgi:hypothetical protein